MLSGISIWPGALGGILSCLGVMVVNALGSWAYGFAFIPYLYFDWLVRVLPGWIVVPGIERMVQLVTWISPGPVDAVSKTIENGLAIGFFILAGALVGAVLLNQQQSRRLKTLVLAWAAGGLFFAMTLVIELSPQFGRRPALIEVVSQGLLFIGWGSIFGFCAYAFLRRPERSHLGVDFSRRRLIVTMGGGVLLPLLAYLAGGWLIRRPAAPLVASKPASTATPEVGARTPVAQRTEINTLVPTIHPPTVTSTAQPHLDDEPDISGARAPDGVGADGRLIPAPGTRVELTDNTRFYRVDINSNAPVIDPANWRLTLAGMVDTPASFSLEELRRRPAVDQIAAITCISNTLGGKLISNTRWTGFRLKDLLTEAGVKPAGSSVQIDSTDGYYESTPLTEAMDDRTLLVYAMNGEALSPEHGFPLRIYVPGHYGMKQPKWITRLTVVDGPGKGFWSDRGWSKVALVNTMSSIDSASARLLDAASNTVPIGGIAFAGDRGIIRVEYQVDNEPWREARLRTPPLSSLSWVQWRANIPYQPGPHTIRVRATDGSGAVQPYPIGDIFPNGATGRAWVDVTF